MDTKQNSLPNPQDNSSANPKVIASEVFTSNESDKKVYVIDDEAIAAQMICFHLHSAGFTNTIEFQDAKLAFERLQQETPDLIVTDLYMPGVGGSFLIKLVRSLPHLLKVPILVVTTEPCKLTHQRLVDSGADLVLTKPFQATHLVERVSDLLAMGCSGLIR